MADTAARKRKTPATKRAPVKRAPPPLPEPPDTGLVDQMRTMAGKVLDAGAATVGAAAACRPPPGGRALRQGKPMEAAADVLKAMMPGLSEPASGRGPAPRCGACARPRA
jgi:hypothetical protein